MQFCEKLAFISRTQSGAPSAFGYTGEQYTAATGLLHLRARDLNPTLGRFLSADPVQPNAPGTQGYNLYAYVANNPTSWVDPSGFSTHSSQFTPAQTAILVALMVSLPAAATLSGAIGLAFLLFGLTIRCALADGCRDLLADMKEMMGNLGSSGLNTIVWTAQTLNEAVAKHPLLPEASLPMQFLAGVGLGLVGLDTVTDFATLITGRDVLTGQVLTPRELFITWLALGVPFVTSAFARGAANTASSYIRNVLVVGESHTFEYSIGLARRNLQFRIIATTLNTAVSGLGNLPSNLTIRTGIDATRLGQHFPVERFDDIIFNAPRSLRGWQGASGDLVDNVLTSASNVLNQNGTVRFSSSHGMLAGNRLWGHAGGGTARFPLPNGYGIPAQIAYLADEVFGIRYTPLRNDGAALSTALEDMWWFIFTR